MNTLTPVSPEILKKYLGNYDFAEIEHMKLEVKLEKEKLFVYQEGENQGELIPENDSIFFAEPKSGESFEKKKRTQLLIKSSWILKEQNGGKEENKR